MINILRRSSQNASLRYVIPGLLLIALLALGFFAGSLLSRMLSSPPSQVSQPGKPGGAAIVEPPYQVQDFTLTSHRGTPLSLSDLRGRSVLMFFGYTHCPDVCPTTLADYHRAKALLGDTADDVAFVFISVDGRRDTPEVMSEYLGKFDADFIGLTGDPLLLRQIGTEYGLVFEQVAADASVAHEDDHREGDHLDKAHYFVQHTSPSFLIDPQGYLRSVYFYGTAPQSIADGLSALMHSAD